jgi:uncharacterized Zn-finger protein
MRLAHCNRNRLRITTQTATRRPLQLKAPAKRSHDMTDEIIPHFHNDLGVQVVEIGTKKFMCMGALPPQDHPHVFCDMGEDVEYALIAQRSIGTIPRWRLTKHARRNVNSTTFFDDNSGRNCPGSNCGHPLHSRSTNRQRSPATLHAIALGMRSGISVP